MPFSVLWCSRRMTPLFPFLYNSVVDADFSELVPVVVFTQTCYFSASQISHQFTCFELRAEANLEKVTIRFSGFTYLKLQQLTS